MAADPNGINYPEDPELRRILANEIRKLQESTPERKATTEASKHWSEYAAKVVKRIQSERGN
jgi:hypothetical protein